MVSSNTLLTPTIIAKEALMQLENNMVMGQLVHRQYKKEFVKRGTSITIRKPNKFTVTEAQARSNTDLSESSTTLTVSTQAHVSWAFSSVELTMTIEEYSDRYITPACIALANSVDLKVCGLYDDVHNCVGTPGTTPGSFRALADALQRLDEEGCPQNVMRNAVFDPAGNWSMLDGLKGIFNQEIAKDIVTRGKLKTVGNADIYMDQNIKKHLTGAFTTGCAPQVNGAAQTGTSLLTKGWKASTVVLKAGDVFTLEGVYAVNPVSGESTGVLRQFVSTTTVTSDGSGLASITIYPGILATTAYKTCTASPANNAVITPVGVESTYYPQNLVFHKNAFALVTVPVEMPAGVWGARETYNSLSIRVVKQYDIDADEEIIRLDILYGVKTLYPELAARLVG